jgi:hypothetical protein
MKMLKDQTPPPGFEKGRTLLITNRNGGSAGKFPAGTLFKLQHLAMWNDGIHVAFPTDDSSGYYMSEVIPATKIVARFYGKK